MSRSIVALGIVLGLGCFISAGWSAPAPKDKPDPKASDDEVKAELVEATGLKAATLRTKSSNNLKQIVLALFNYESSYGFLPQNVVDNNGKRLLSWRVHLLPFLEQANLYNQFKLDEPWDSANNIKLVDQMPVIFASPRVKVAKKGHTVYQGFEGDGAYFRGGQLKIIDITDGTANTIAVVEASTAVPWSKPIDLPFDEKKEVPNFGKIYGNKPLVAIADGSVKILDLNKIKPATLKAAITIAAGDLLGDDWK